MATTPAPIKQNMVIRKGSGDKPDEKNEGHVIPGKALRERWGISAAPADAQRKPEPKPEEIPAEAEASPVVPVIRKPNGRFAKNKPAAAPITPKVIAEIANEVVRAGEAARKPAAPALPEPTASLTTQQQKRYKVLQRMETMNPANKGKAEAYATASKKLSEYQSAWEKDEANKGKKFNLSDEDHAEFVKSNDVDYDEDEYAEALADMKAEERTKPFEEKFKAQEEQQKKSARVTQIMPQIVAHQRSAGRVFVDKLGEEFKGLLNEGNVVVPEVLEKIKGQGRVYEQVLGMAGRVEMVAAELMGIAQDMVPFDGKNPLHVEIFHLAERKDKEFKTERDEGRLPEELNGGKEFATTEEWNAMSGPERASHWHLTDSDLSALYAAEMAEAARKLIDDDNAEFTSRAKKRGLIKDDQQPPPVRQPAQQPPARQPVLTERSPVAAVAPRVAPTAELPKTQIESLKKRWTS